MPIIPFDSRTNRPALAALRAPPSEPFALMAAAQMHSEGRLLDPESTAPDERPSEVPNNRTKR